MNSIASIITLDFVDSFAFAKGTLRRRRNVYQVSPPHLTLVDGMFGHCLEPKGFYSHRPRGSYAASCLLAPLYRGAYERYRLKELPRRRILLADT